jgi:alpha-tubulin suppressor-like RCC1 family protein
VFTLEENRHDPARSHPHEPFSSLLILFTRMDRGLSRGLFLSTILMALSCSWQSGPSLPLIRIGAITAGGYHTCALTVEGPGSGPNVPTFEDTAPYNQFPRRLPFLGLSNSRLDSTREVLCWGANDSGQLGNGTEFNKNAPVAVTGLRNVVSAIAAGGRHTCALTASGGAFCWGNNDAGQLGDGTEAKKSAPVEVVGLTSGVRAITAGGAHTCALTTRGSVKCWGRNDSGQLGNGTETNASMAVDVVGLTNGIIAIEAGRGHTCALAHSGVVKCWGDNEDGQLGDGTTVDKSTPVDVMGLTRGARAIAAGGYHSCAVTTTGGAMCWGDNSQGQLGNGAEADKTAPSVVIGLSSGISAISAGSGLIGESESFVSAHTCAVTIAGGILCWGNNDDGELGAGGVVDQNTPVEVAGLTNGIGAVAAGGLHTCALTTSGAVKCWGDNSQGQLGNGLTSDSLVPVDVVLSMHIPVSIQFTYARRYQ